MKALLKLINKRIHINIPLFNNNQYIKLNRYYLVNHHYYKPSKSF